MILNNPFGLLALLGIPAVLLIHFLQRQARIIPVSTLFLLEQTQRESTSGRRFDRITNSIPLWLQLLMVLLLTWLLVEPRYQKTTSTQQLAIVLDSSASMSVFKESLQTTLEEEIPKLKGPATQLQLYLVESDPNAPILYSGNSASDALKSLEAWSPTAGALDPNASLRLARSRIRREGLLIYATDTYTEDELLPFEAQLLAVGSPTSNIGFTGLSFSEDEKSWQATVRNYSDNASDSQWHVLFPDGSRSEPKPLSLAPNGLTTLTGGFPEGIKSLTVELAGDAFTLDDRLPIIRPQPKVLSVASQLPAKFNDFQTRFLNFFPDLNAPPTAATLPDLTLSAYDPLLPVLPNTNSVITINESTKSRKFLSGGIVAEPHPLIKDLNWQALQSRETIPFPLTENDTVLLWQGQRPLIALREDVISNSEELPHSSQKNSHLIFNFDLTLSNALKLPSTVILLHRFTSSLRDNKAAYEAMNTETNQKLQLATTSSPSPLTVTFLSDSSQTATTSHQIDSIENLHAPSIPTSFIVEQGDTLLLESTCHFADTREADLRNAQSKKQLSSLSASAVNRNTKEDHLWPLWCLLTLLALLTAWHFTREKRTEQTS